MKKLEYSIDKDTGKPRTLFYVDEDDVEIDIAVFEDWDAEIEELVAWAKLIVKACNNFEQLRKALKFYGNHLPHCNLASPIPCVRRNSKPVGCTCGFDEAIAATKEKM